MIRTLGDYVRQVGELETMSTADLEAAAAALYRAGAPTGPAWDQLGDTTRSVWRERVALMNEQQPAEPAAGDIL